MKACDLWSPSRLMFILYSVPVQIKTHEHTSKDNAARSQESSTDMSPTSGSTLWIGFFFLNSWTPLPNGLCLDVQCQAIFGTLQWRGFGGTIVQLLNWPACYLKYLAQNKSWGVELLISSIKMETINSQIFTGCEVLQASNS